MSTYTLEEYEAKLRSHDPAPSEESIKHSVQVFREFLDAALRSGRNQELIDCRTGKPGIICYPYGVIEWIETEKEETNARI